MNFRLLKMGSLLLNGLNVDANIIRSLTVTLGFSANCRNGKSWNRCLRDKVHIVSSLEALSSPESLSSLCLQYVVPAAELFVLKSDTIDLILSP